MKIDTSSINLFAARHYSETRQVKTQKEINFFSLLNHRIDGYSQEAGISRMVQGVPAVLEFPGKTVLTSYWYEKTIHQNQTVISLSDQFVDQLDKMMQIIDGIMQKLETSNVFRKDRYRYRMVHMDRIHINPRNRIRHVQPGISTFAHQYHTYREEEKTQFAADGMIKTMDGRQIDFSLGMNLDRKYYEKDQVEYIRKGGPLKDPLVINVDGSIPELSDIFFSFDMDMDGKKEQIRALEPGSGFLSLDRNKDGIINDGSELFGPATDNGFLELTDYDHDRNDWIDENDAIYDELTIWENDETGEMKLTRLKDAGIGAIYLQHLDTRFNITDENNQLQARIERSGIALNEDSTARSIQEINWTV